LKAKATAKAKTLKCKTRAYFRNCQTWTVSPAEPGDYPTDLKIMVLTPEREIKRYCILMHSHMYSENSGKFTKTKQ
jgi:hypothetical protein